jgi:hypothetical protein
MALEKAEGRESGEDIHLGGVLAEELDGADAGRVQGVVDVLGEVVVDYVRGEGDAGGPLLD